MARVGRLAAALIMVVLVTATAHAEARDAEVAAWQALRDGEAVLIIRHALAPGTGDPAGFRLGDCRTQRNLNETGRQQSRAWGDFLRAQGIVEARVLSSEWCRAWDTATGMGLGVVEALPALNSFFQDRSQGPARLSALIGFLNGQTHPEPLVLVTHQVNMTGLTGLVPRSNEGFILPLPVAPDSPVLLRILPP